MEKLMKLIAKKKQEGKEMDPMQKEAKMSMLKTLRDEMSGMMKNDLMNPEHKIEVASNDEEGLKRGLDKAKEILNNKSEDESESDKDELEKNEDEHSDMEESEENDDSDDNEEDSHLSPEEELLLKKLLAKQAKNKI